MWAVAFSPDGQTLVTGSEDKTVKIWDVLTGQCLQTLYEDSDSPTGDRYTSRIWLVAVNPDGESLLSISENQTMKLWDVCTGQCLRNAQILASGSRDQTVKLWDWHTGECLHTLQGHIHEVNISEE